MKHLTVDEILDFVSLTEFNSASMKLSAAVNGHIRNCEKCLKQVRAFQMTYDAFSGMNAGDDFKKYVADHLSDIIENDVQVACESALDEPDGYR